ncbi:MAG: NADH:flavin oxidoreductase [Peptococcaceae bacterium]|nr:NADH:flavin oxidoreductase [Peptococcaceae bacterium]
MSSVFSPLQIKNLRLSNRLVMPPMALDHASEKGEVTSELIDHYLERAEGLGLVIVEHTYILPEGKAHPRQLGIYDDALLPGLKALVDRVHKLGVPIGLQITHAGARALNKPQAPSALFCPHLTRFGLSPELSAKEIPAELSIEDMKNICAAFARAAARAQEAGFDLVEIHGAHGYLLNQFYSPLTNRRTDEYGGSLENRLRFPLEVIAAVKRTVGPDMPVFYRLGADDRLPGGNGVDESKKAVPLLVNAGVDCLDLSGGICGYLKKGPPGFFNYLAKEIKPVANIPVLVTGGINSLEMAEELVAAGIADLVGIGRALLSDPAWLKKAKEKRYGSK